MLFNIIVDESISLHVHLWKRKKEKENIKLNKKKSCIVDCESCDLLVCVATRTVCSACSKAAPKQKLRQSVTLVY